MLFRSALLACATEVVPLEPRRDKERESHADEHRTEHEPCDAVRVAIALGEDYGEAEEEGVLEKMSVRGTITSVSDVRTRSP